MEWISSVMVGIGILVIDRPVSWLYHATAGTIPAIMRTTTPLATAMVWVWHMKESKVYRGVGMKNQICERVKVNIFGFLDKHFIQMIKKIFLCFLCSLKTEFKMFSGTVLFFYMIIWTRMGKYTRSVYPDSLISNRLEKCAHLSGSGAKIWLRQMQSTKVNHGCGQQSQTP